MEKVTKVEKELQLVIEDLYNINYHYKANGEVNIVTAKACDRFVSLINKLDELGIVKKTVELETTTTGLRIL